MEKAQEGKFPSPHFGIEEVVDVRVGEKLATRVVPSSIGNERPFRFIGAIIEDIDGPQLFGLAWLSRSRRIHIEVVLFPSRRKLRQRIARTVQRLYHVGAEPQSRMGRPD